MNQNNRIEKVVVWNRKALLCMGDVHHAVEGCRDAVEFEELMNLYRSVCDEADKNVRFDLDYWGDEELEERILGYRVLKPE